MIWHLLPPGEIKAAKNWNGSKVGRAKARYEFFAPRATMTLMISSTPPLPLFFAAGCDMKQYEHGPARRERRFRASRANLAAKGKYNRRISQAAAFRARLTAAILEGLAMTNWVVIYRTSPGAKETRSPSAPTERRALAQARALHFQGCEVLRIKGPDDTAVPDHRINHWIANGRDRYDLAE